MRTKNCLPKEKNERKPSRCVVGLAIALMALNVLRRFVTTRPIKLLDEISKEEKKSPANKDSKRKVVRLDENSE